MKFMKSSIPILLSLTLGLVVCAQFSGTGTGGEKPAEGQKSNRTRQPTLVVRIDNAVDVEKLLDGRTTAIYDCIRVLKKPADPTSFEANMEKVRAASLLGTLRASDHQDAVELLVENLTFRSSLIVLEDHPLLGFSAAEAIVEIGSPAMGKLLEYLAPERTDDELRLVAFIIERVDSRELGRCRIDLEIKRVLAISPDLREIPDAHMKNLYQLQKWFSDAEFFTQEDNWPGRSRDKK